MKKVWKSALLAVLVVTALGSCGESEAEEEAKPKVEGPRRMPPEDEARFKADAIQFKKNLIYVSRGIDDEFDAKVLEYEAELIKMENDTYNWDSLFYDNWRELDSSN